MPSLTRDISKSSKLHEKLIRAVKARILAAQKSEARDAFVKKWRDAENRTVGYMPERNVDAMRRQEREGGKPTYTTITIPYSHAVMLASHTYWTTVFLGRNPIMQLQGLHGEGEMQVQAIEALQAYQTSMGGHLVPYHTWLYDAGKYGVGVIGEYWDEEEHIVSSIEEQPAASFAGVTVGKPKKVKITRRIKGYEGNKLFNVRPMDFFHDPRVTMADFQSGEFCGRWVAISWAQLSAWEDQGYYVNLDHARKEAEKASINREQSSLSMMMPKDDQFGMSHVDGRLAGESLPCYEMYVNLVPKEWGLGDSPHHEKWVFVVNEQYTVLLAARPLGAYHNRFPFSVLEMEPEGYGVYNRGIPEVTSDIENTINWLINSHFYNVRKTLNNEVVVDPSRVEMADLKNPLPGGIIRLKPGAYGQDVRTALSQNQIQDVTRANISDMNMMMSLGERITGVNDQIMGIANPSSRRSATEVRSSNTFSVNRLKTTSEYFSAIGFTPLSRRLVQNSQQYYDGEKKLRLTGNAGLMAGNQFINVTPEMISGFYDFVPVDGTLPVDRFAQAQMWRALLAEMKQIPPLMAQYDIGKIFAFVAQLTGLKNVEQFRIQVQPDGLLQAAAQQGNVVPMGGAGGKAGLTPGEGLGDIG